MRHTFQLNRRGLFLVCVALFVCTSLHIRSGANSSLSLGYRKSSDLDRDIGNASVEHKNLGSTCASSSTGDNQICSLSRACWHSDKAKELHVFEELGLFDVFEQTKEVRVSDSKFIFVNASDTRWEDVSKLATVVLKGTTVLQTLYQSAFQHFTPEYIPLLPMYWNPTSFLATCPARSIFLTIDPWRYSEEYINALYSSSASCTITSHESNRIPLRYPFSTIEEALGPTFHEEFWCREENTCASGSRTLLGRYSICFENIVMALQDMDQWYFDQENADTLVTKILGRRSTQNAVCINQRKGTRQIINFDEVRALVKKTFDIEPSIIFFEGMTFFEQVAAVDPCMVLLAPHGGGMTNSIFVRRGASVIEFFPYAYQPTEFYGKAVWSAGANHYPVILPSSRVVLSAECEHYRDAVSESCNLAVNTTCYHCFKDGSMVVDVNQLEPMLRSLAREFRGNGDSTWQEEHDMGRHM